MLFKIIHSRMLLNSAEMIFITNQFLQHKSNIVM